MKKLLLFICFLAVGNALDMDTLPREEDGTSPTGKFFLIQNQIC